MFYLFNIKNLQFFDLVIKKEEIQIIIFKFHSSEPFGTLTSVYFF